ncbi:MAG: PAS domain-containing protein, partial [Cryomorphaceae bacterium]
MVDLEKELVKYKNHLEQLLRVQEAGKVGYWALYSDRDLLEWSAETYKIFDLPTDTPITYKDMLTYVHPEDQNWVDETWQNATKVGHYDISYRIISSTKKTKWIEAHGDAIIDDDGYFVRALGIVRDITEQKEGELKLEALTKSLKRSQKIGRLGGWTIEASSPSEIDINEEAKEIFSWTKDEPPTMAQWESILHPDDRGKTMLTFSKAMKGEGEYDVEYRITFNDKVKWVKAVGEMEFDSKGQFSRAVGVVQDITDFKVQQENLRAAR